MGIIRQISTFFLDTYIGAKHLKPLERLDLYEAIFDYMFYDISPTIDIRKPTTIQGFMGCKKALDNAKFKYDRDVKNGEMGKEYGQLGAEYGYLGGRPKKQICGGYEKPPANPQKTPSGGYEKPPKTPQELELEYICQSVSQSDIIKKNNNLNNSACADVEARACDKELDEDEYSEEKENLQTSKEILSRISDSLCKLNLSNSEIFKNAKNILNNMMEKVAEKEYFIIDGNNILSWKILTHIGELLDDENKFKSAWMTAQESARYNAKNKFKYIVSTLYNIACGI